MSEQTDDFLKTLCLENYRQSEFTLEFVRANCRLAYEKGYEAGRDDAAEAAFYDNEARG